MTSYVLTTRGLAGTLLYAYLQGILSLWGGLAVG